MTVTTRQCSDLGGINDPDDLRPGTLDVGWAEDALRRLPRDGQPKEIQRSTQRPWPTRSLRRVMAAVTITICLMVGISIAPGETSPALREAPKPLSVTSGTLGVRGFQASSARVGTLPAAVTCSSSRSTGQAAVGVLDLFPTPCLSLPFVRQGT